MHYEKVLTFGLISRKAIEIVQFSSVHIFYNPSSYNILLKTLITYNDYELHKHTNKNTLKITIKR